MTIKNIVDALPAIRKIANQDLSMPTLYKVKMLMDKLDVQYRFYDEGRSKIITKYCDERDGKYVPRETEKEELEKGMREILAVEIDAKEIKPVTIPATENLKLSYADLSTLDGLIKINFDEENGDT